MDQYSKERKEALKQSKRRIERQKQLLREAGLPADRKDSKKATASDDVQVFISDLEECEFTDQFKDRKAQALNSAL